MAYEKDLSSNADVIYAEYPIAKILPRVRVKTAKVRRWTQELLDHSAVTRGCVEKFYLIDECGEVIARVGKSRVLFFFEGTRDETMGQALARIGNEQTRRIRYAVICCSSDATPWCASGVRAASPQLVLYKLPAGFTNAADWLRSLVEAGRGALRHEDEIAA